MFGWLKVLFPTPESFVRVLFGFLLGLTVAMFAAASTAHAADLGGFHGATWVRAGFSPPHNEQVITGSQEVARYAVEMGGEIRTSRVSGGLQLNALGAQGWQPRELVGSGLDAWSGSNWTVRHWSADVDAWTRLRVKGPFHLTGEGRATPFGLKGRPYFYRLYGEIRAEF